MPNLKIFVDETIFASRREAIAEMLHPVRTLLCDELKVETATCQLAVIPVLAMADLPRVNVEMHIMPRPERTRELVLGVCERLRAVIGEATEAHVAVRVATLDPATYVSLT